MDKKTKYLGFRLQFDQYLKIIESAQKSGVSITDFIMSILLPKINQKHENIITLKPIKNVIEMVKTEKENDKKEVKVNSEEILLNAKKKFDEINNLKI